MDAVESINTTEVERFFVECSRLAKGLVVGNFEVLMRELGERSFSISTTQILLNLTGLYWGRAVLEELEFEFSDNLRVVSGDTELSILLESWDVYRTVTSKCSLLTGEWLNSIAKNFSKEYVDLLARLDEGIHGDIRLVDPSVVIVE